MKTVTVRHINKNDEMAAITTSEGNCIGINLWELFPHKREYDGFYSWKYQEMDK